MLLPDYLFTPREFFKGERADKTHSTVVLAKKIKWTSQKVSESISFLETSNQVYANGFAIDWGEINPPFGYIFSQQFDLFILIESKVF